MARVFLLRHTRTDVPADFCYGHTDVSLSPCYQEQLLRIKQQLLLTIPRAKVYSSPASRCRRLAEDLEWGPVCLADDLRELHFGTWEGRLWSEIPRAESEAWTADFVDSAPPGGESFRALERRAIAFIGELQQVEHDAIVCVTHSGVIRALLCWDRQLELSQAFEQAVAFGELFELLNKGRSPKQLSKQSGASADR